MQSNLTRRLGAEFLGTAFLLATIAGSGIMGESLFADQAGGRAGATLLPHSLAIGAILFVMITLLGPIRGVRRTRVGAAASGVGGGRGGGDCSLCMVTQVIAGIIGVWFAHRMFDISILQSSAKARAGLGQWSAEVVATFGLVFTILAGLKARPQAVPALVGLYIMAALWFTASTGFANPAVTVARMLTDTFSGIAPADAPAFIAAQLAGAALAVPAARFLWPDGT